jgi:Arc/MetJ family transcription regulator
MKRARLTLPAELLEEATRLTGARTYSAAVTQALEELVRRLKARQILQLQGSGLWRGDLSEMRDR